jgi:DNA-binding PadR family transcriptional regulator
MISKGGGALPKADDFSGLLSSYTTELRRGSLLLAVLGVLIDTKYYGYELLKILSDRGIDMDANTLYPLLRRLEAQGLLEGTWDTTESRPRKYFAVSADGRAVFRALTAEWEKLSDTITKVIKEAK